MRPEGVAAAARELKRAKRACRRISTAPTMEDAEDAWCDFLTHSGNIYTKLRAACYGHPLDFGWFGKQLDERARDPLLLYIHKARNSETHRLEATVEQAPEASHDAEINNRPVRINFPRHLRPVPVTDEHGNVYDAPTTHFDEPLGYCDASMLALFATIYFEWLVNAASSRLR